MKRNINKIVAATLLATTFVACSDEIENGTYGTPYNANTSSIASAGTAVDLGLPSGTMWADKNVGAASSQDMGLSFIWGDVTGTQLSIAANTYGQGLKVNMQPYFDMFKKYNADPEKDASECIKVEYDTIQFAKQDFQVEAVDSIRPNHNYQILITRTANVQVKNPDGSWKMDADTIVREKKVFVEIDSLILMGYDEKTATENKDKFLKTYLEDKYNKYTVEKCEYVFTTDIVKKLVPAAGQSVVDDFIAEQKAKSGKDEIWYYFTNGVLNESDSYLHADLIVEVRDTLIYREKNWQMDDVPALSIVGNAELDAATKNWGAGWAMPTSAQLEELINECTWEFVDNAYKVTGKNGNSIFLPAAGYRYEAKQIGAGASGYYASGEVYGKYTYPTAKEQMAGGYGTADAYSMANILTFNAGQFDNSKRIMNKFAEKNIGFSIRPVVKK